MMGIWVSVGGGFAYFDFLCPSVLGVHLGFFLCRKISDTYALLGDLLGLTAAEKIGRTSSPLHPMLAKIKAEQGSERTDLREDSE